MNPQRQSFRATLALVGAGGLWLAAAMGAAAQTTNIVWRAQLTGVLGIQEYRANLTPHMTVAAFGTKDLVRMVTGTALATGQSLALDVEMQGGVTNLYLSLYDRINRVAVRRFTAGESTLLFQDGTKFAVTADLPIPSSVISGSNAVPTGLAYGLLRIAGTGREVRGIPASFQTTVRGFLIDPRTGEGGTTSLIMRATLSAGGVPLKIQPPLLY